MRILPVLLAVILVFTACGHISLKPGVKKPATTTVPKNEQSVNTPAATSPAATSQAATSQAAVNVRITIVPPPDIQSGDGVAGSSYIFTVTNEGLPVGATYTWFIDEQPGGNGDKGTFTFSVAKPYIIKVVATWTDASGVTQRANSSLTVDIQSKPKLTINFPDGLNGMVGQAYRFSAKSEGIPIQAAYTYYADESMIGTGDCNYVARFTPQYTKNSPYVIKVTAQWTTLAGTQTANDSVKFTVTGTQAANGSVMFQVEGKPSLSLRIPSGTGGPGVGYTFVVKPANIPAGAIYTWYINGIDVHAGGIDELTAYAPAGFFVGGMQYSIRVVAVWNNSAGTMFTTSADGVFTCYR
ncbi:MAG: hypothetical protein NTZ34_00765 [Chloroflexi bacterium]|nr:hypothetical protein [Chloroflexota bacterium]